MGDFALIFQILGGLLAIFFIFLTVMNTKTWQWLHVTAMFLVFAAVCVLAPFAAMALKTRFAWVKAHDELAKKVEEQDKNYHDLIYGNPSAPDGGRDSLVAVKNELSRFILDRGRVVRQCRPALNADGTVTLQVVGPAAAAPTGGAPPAGGAPPVGGAPPAGAAPPAAGAAAAPAAATARHGFKAQEVVFAFVESPDPTNTWLVPVFYLGQFEVTAATDDSITLRRTVPPNPVVQQETQATWSVCETLPPDMHEVFDFAVEKRVEEFKKLFPVDNAGVPPEVYNRMLADYLRDGQPAEDTDPPENVWIKVKFEQDHEVVVDAATLVSPITSELFDSVGQAQAARLQRGEPVKFKKGETGLFDKQTADTLIANKTASLAEGQARIFRRKLNDYENAFATINRRIIEVRAEIARADQHLTDLNVAIQKANEQIKILEGKKTMLGADLAKVEHERDELRKYLDKLSQQVAEVRAELSRLYGSNLQMHKDLKAASERLTEEIDRRTREATAASTP
jgi:hypothetical protein